MINNVDIFREEDLDQTSLDPNSFTKKRSLASSWPRGKHWTVTKEKLMVEKLMAEGKRTWWKTEIVEWRSYH